MKRIIGSLKRPSSESSDALAAGDRLLGCPLFRRSLTQGRPGSSKLDSAPIYPEDSPEGIVAREVVSTYCLRSPCH